MSQSKPDEPLSFEESLAALEDAVRRLEDGELDLSDALGAFESGIGHLKCCYRRLEEAERRIDLLCGVDSSGRAQVKPLAEEGMSLEEKQQARSRRRSHSPNPAIPSSPSSTDSGDLESGHLDSGHSVDGDGRLF